MAPFAEEAAVADDIDFIGEDATGFAVLLIEEGVLVDADVAADGDILSELLTVPEADPYVEVKVFVGQVFVGKFPLDDQLLADRRVLQEGIGGLDMIARQVLFVDIFGVDEEVLRNT